MTPDPIPAIRQRVEKAHGGKPYDIADRNEHAADDLDALLAAWDTQQTALRRLVEHLRQVARETNEQAQHRGYTELHRAEFAGRVLALGVAANEIAALLPPQAEP